MKLEILYVFLLSFFYFTGNCQNNTERLDTCLARKITISSFCLCQTTLAELKSNDSELQEVELEEMEMCKDGFVQDSRYNNRKGYYSKKHPGIIFQKDNDYDFISKIRLTKDFIGALPDGTPISMKTLLVKDVLNFYPKFNTWKSRGCSDYWNLTNDTLSFFVKIDRAKQPRYPVDENFYLEKAIEGIDLVISCYSIHNKSPELVLFNPDDPVYFIDSMRVNKGALKWYAPEEIAFVNVYKDSMALKTAGKEAKNGAIYITTKSFARDFYWNYFKSKSINYFKSVPDLKSELRVIYILNGKVLESNYEDDLFYVNDSNFVELTVIDTERLKKDFNISEGFLGVVIKTFSK